MWKWKGKYIFLLPSIHVLPPFIIITTIFVIYIFAIVIVIATIMINLVSPLRETAQVVSVDASQKKFQCSPVEMLMFP